jgi:hypothetical protein
MEVELIFGGIMMDVFCEQVDIQILPKGHRNIEPGVSCCWVVLQR